MLNNTAAVPAVPTAVQDAIYAASYLRHNCGKYAARRYCQKRGILAIYRLCCQLEAAKGFCKL